MLRLGAFPPAIVNMIRSLSLLGCCSSPGCSSDSIDLLYASLGDEGAERIWRQVVEGYRGALREAAGVLVARGFVPAHLDVGEVSDRLWFCFGIAAWRTLLKDCGWGYGRAESWLGTQAVAALGGLVGPGEPESG
ncbi:hypothetical protein [Nocardiopsis valliformis]|uniref:hypothetical protein n=1 Tax=Nocardiopsis valliformis TaxID=239974 RepID=UPI000376A7CC|nr:hypothetical protein [Nocardiopsis valliformis]